MKYERDEYINCDPIGAERDTIVRCEKVRLSKLKKTQVCYGVMGGDSHNISTGSISRVATAVVDGKWGRCDICIDCLYKWLDFINN